MLKQVFDFIRYSDDMHKLLDLIENDAYYKAMDEDAFHVVTKYTNSKELVKAKDYSIKGGKNDVCKAIQDLMADSREKGIKEGREEGREEGEDMLVLLLQKLIADNRTSEIELVAKDEAVRKTLYKEYGIR